MHWMACTRYFVQRIAIGWIYDSTEWMIVHIVCISDRILSIFYRLDVREQKNVTAFSKKKELQNTQSHDNFSIKPLLQWLRIVTVAVKALGSMYLFVCWLFSVSYSENYKWHTKHINRRHHSLATLVVHLLCPRVRRWLLNVTCKWTCKSSAKNGPHIDKSCMAMWTIDIISIRVVISIKVAIAFGWTVFFFNFPYVFYWSKSVCFYWSRFGRSIFSIQSREYFFNSTPDYYFQVPIFHRVLSLDATILVLFHSNNLISSLIFGRFKWKLTLTHCARVLCLTM